MVPSISNIFTDIIANILSNYLGENSNIKLDWNQRHNTYL